MPLYYLLSSYVTHPTYSKDIINIPNNCVLHSSVCVCSFVHYSNRNSILQFYFITINFEANLKVYKSNAWIFVRKIMQTLFSRSKFLFGIRFSMHGVCHICILYAFVYADQRYVLDSISLRVHAK